MAVSDDLTKLAARAKEAEERVAAAREKSKADLEADLEYARGVGEEEAKGLRETAEEGKGRISDRWNDVQEAWNQAIAKVREDVDARRQSMACTRRSEGPKGRRTTPGLRSTSPTRRSWRPSTRS
jgi:flagellar biosynthesis/type III secretory pathway protein FliH